MEGGRGRQPTRCSVGWRYGMLQPVKASEEETEGMTQAAIIITDRYVDKTQRKAGERFEMENN